ncbi:MAG: MFS transporter [Bacteroides sp. SM1_62]|nr:MAG: MFS transporter [Bacteroides sp. SM23_62]KPL25741.1 MAG: MFS transporter [Bacteroides sp. SM1_62]
MISKNKRSKNLVITIATIAATGGLLFGFDTGVISGAQNFLQDAGGWGISDSQLEWVTTAVLIGAVLGAALSGRITDILGRKIVIIIAAVIFAVGAIFTGAAPSVSLLVIGRIIIGIAIGIASFSVPLYISEISPTRNRGALVTMNQLMITIGILVSYISDYLIANDANPFSWRWMFYVGFFPALILLVGMFFVPETPRWLIGKGREEQGRRILNKVEEPELVDEAVEKIKADIARESESASYGEIFKPWLRTALVIAVGIMFFQQFTGINTIIYYSPKIFKIAGIESNTLTILPSILLGAVNVLFTVVSIMLLDKLGRRPLYFIGMVGMIVGLCGVGLSFFFEDSLGASLKYFTVASMFIYIIFFAVSLGPLGWLIISEVFPLKIRGVGMSIGSLSNWLFNGIVAFTFLKLVNALSPAGAFWLYAAIGVLGIYWGNKFIPETKGITLEKIEDHWREGKKPRELSK